MPRIFLGIHHFIKVFNRILYTVFGNNHQVCPVSDERLSTCTHLCPLPPEHLYWGSLTIPDLALSMHETGHRQDMCYYVLRRFKLNLFAKTIYKCFNATSNRSVATRTADAHLSCSMPEPLLGSLTRQCLL